MAFFHDSNLTTELTRDKSSQKDRHRVSNISGKARAIHMSRASQANWADLSHENLYFSTR